MYASLIIALCLSAFFSGMEIAFVSSNKLRMEMDKAQSSPSSRIASTFYDHPNDFIATMLVGNNIALVVYGIIFADLLNPLLTEHCGITQEWLLLLLQTVISTLVVLVTGEFLPKTIFRLNPNGMLLFFAPLAYIFYIILFPISRLTSSLSRMLLRLLGQKVPPRATERAFTRVDLDYLLQQSAATDDDAGGAVEEVRIFQRALDFATCKVRDCIVPRTEIIAASTEESLSSLLARFIESGQSKIIVYKDDIDDILGFIHSSEMFRLGPDDEWQSHIRTVPIVPESMTAQRLMQMLMSQKKSLAVVVDEFGGTSGICTLEDLVEEIFGDIEDEHDQHSLIARRISATDIELSARMEVDKANQQFDLQLPESDAYLTIGGLILAEVGRFPKPGEVVRVGHYEFKILKNTNTKIELVRLHVGAS